MQGGSITRWQRSHFLHLFPVCTLLLAVLPLVARGQFTLTTNNGAISITGYAGIGGAVVIPSATNGFPVVSIAANAFFNKTSMTGVTIPASITNIGSSAFNSCAGLTSVTIPNSVISIGSMAFTSCTSLTNITASAGNPAYSSISGVLLDSLQGTLVQFPGGFPGDYAVPNSVSNISAFAFYGSAALTSVTLSAAVASIAERALDHCFALTNITVDSNNTKFSAMGGVLFDLSQGTLVQCPGGRAGSYVVPNSVTNMGNYAFDGCANITALTIPNSVTTIGSGVCLGCSGLTSINIPASLRNISNNAFFNCASLTNIAIPNSVTNIGDFAFADCYALTSITLPSGVLRIGSYAFTGNSSLISVPVPSNVVTIDVGAFYGCYGITSVTIPDSVTTIGSSAYNSCINLTNVVIGRGITNLGVVFQDCNKLRTITLGCPSIGNWFAGLPLTSVTILNTVTNIGVNAFASLTNLTSVVIGAGVSNIGSNAFNNCYNLTRLTIPSSVTNIGSKAFLNCDGLQSIIFTGNAPSIGASAFSGVFATVYYLPGTAGWGNPFAGLTAYLWNPQLRSDDASFGVRTNRFGFNITGTSNLTVVVEASTNLINWQSVQIKTLTGGKTYFSDPTWTSFRVRHYRVRPP